ncbi:MAG: hypothetical protein LBH95_03290 [Oscillospiraceae bacterium]|jgi:hypothetical protein|nr:hypothetical protein [Oscillospiraceae bacterium]
MPVTTDSLLSQAEQALEAQSDLAALLPYAAELEPHAASPDVFAFFQKLTRAVLCDPGRHFRLFAYCLDAVCAYDPVEGAAFLERMLTFAEGIGEAAAAPQGILH